MSTTEKIAVDVAFYNVGGMVISEQSVEISAEDLAVLAAGGELQLIGVPAGTTKIVYCNDETGEVYDQPYNG